MKKIFVFILISGFCFTSCSQRIADLTVVSSKNMDLNNSRGYMTSPNDRISGIDKNNIIIVFPTNPNLSWKEAIDKAIESRPYCVGLSNVTIEMGGWYIPLIAGESWYEVEGDPIYLRN